MVTSRHVVSTTLTAYPGGGDTTTSGVPEGAALVLIVEDNALSRRLFNDLLEANGYATRATGSGLEGMLLAHSLAPDLILLDIQLPDTSGIDVTRRLKADPRTREIPIVVVTASLLPDIRRKAWDAGCDGFLEKPIDIDGFLGEIAGQLRPRAHHLH